MKKIAITSSMLEEDKYCGLKARYFNFILNAIEEFHADVMPVMLPQTDNASLIRAYAEEYDGFIFSGGSDIHPKYYGEEIHENCGTIKEIRDVFELGLAKEVRDLDKPALGICRGHQVMAVAAGASLWQDIPSQVGTTVVHAKNNGTMRHLVKTSGKLREIVGADVIATNSYHHQAVKDYPDTIDICGRNMDDEIIEAMHDPSKRYYFSVQWHPESHPNKESFLIVQSFFEAVGAL